MQFKTYLEPPSANFFIVDKDQYGISKISAVLPEAHWVRGKGFQEDFLKKFSGYALLCERNQPQIVGQSDVFFTRTGDLVEAPFIKNKKRIIQQLMDANVTSVLFSNTSQECKLTRPLLQEEADFVFEQMMKDIFKSGRLLAEEDRDYILNSVLEDSMLDLPEEIFLNLRNIVRD
jgi:hypothetical protein